MRVLRKEEEINGGFLNATIDEKHGFPEHVHDHFELEFILEGTCDFFVNGKAYRLEKDMVTIMTPAQVHKIGEERMLLINVEFDSNGVELPVWDYRRPLVLHLNREDAEFVRLLLEEIVRYHDEKPQYALRLLGCVLEKVVPSEDLEENLHEMPFRQILLYVMENFRNNLTLEVLAKKFGLSECYVSDLFARKFGINFKEYLDSLRFSYACAQLAFSEQPIRVICMESGFGDYANFSRRFHLKYGMSPREYRKQNQA